MSSTSLGDVILVALICKVLTYLWVAFELPKGWETRWIGRLHDCEKCSGVWIYSILFGLLRVDIFPLLGLQSFGTVGTLIGGAIISFFVFLLSVGFREQYMSFYIE